MRVLAVSCLVLAAAGCGGAPAPERVRGGQVEVRLDDFHIDPQRIRARPGPTTFVAVNEGRLGHNFRLRRGPGEPLKITTMLPGERDTGTIDLRRGDYRMVCTVANHEELGMTGTLIVR